MQTLVRIREQIPLQRGRSARGRRLRPDDRLTSYAGRLADGGLVTAQSRRFLAAAVATQANVLAYQDGFLAAAAGAGVFLVLVALMRPGRPSPF